MDDVRSNCLRRCLELAKHGNAEQPVAIREPKPATRMSVVKLLKGHGISGANTIGLGIVSIALYSQP
jgi:hypothetical protein